MEILSLTKTQMCLKEAHYKRFNNFRYEKDQYIFVLGNGNLCRDILPQGTIATG